MIEREIYTINWSKLAHILTPMHWRKPKLIAWVIAMASLSNDLYDRFLSFKTKVNYNLLITPQVCFLEKALNDRWDIALRRIYIKDGSEFLGKPFFRKIESKPVPVFRKSEAEALVLYRKTETAQSGDDFIIFVPADIVFDSPEMKAFVNGYKLATKKFSIKIF